MLLYCLLLLYHDGTVASEFLLSCFIAVTALWAADLPALPSVGYWIALWFVHMRVTLRIAVKFNLCQSLEIARHPRYIHHSKRGP